MPDRSELDALKKQLIQAEQARQEAEQARQEAERQTQLLHSLFQQAPTLLMVLRGPDHVVDWPIRSPARCSGEPRPRC